MLNMHVWCLSEWARERERVCVLFSIMFFLKNLVVCIACGFFSFNPQCDFNSSGHFASSFFPLWLLFSTLCFVSSSASHFDVWFHRSMLFALFIRYAVSFLILQALSLCYYCCYCCSIVWKIFFNSCDVWWPFCRHSSCLVVFLFPSHGSVCVSCQPSRGNKLLSSWCIPFHLLCNNYDWIDRGTQKYEWLFLGIISSTCHAAIDLFLLLLLLLLVLLVWRGHIYIFRW